MSELRQKHPQKILLEVCDLKRSTYYYNLNKEPKERHEVEKAKILAVYRRHKKIYGYRRITLWMHDNGYTINHKTVYKLMKELHIQGKHAPKKFRPNKEEQGDIKKNILNREFSSNKPKEKMTTDTTVFKVNGKLLYFSPVLDMHNGEILSYEYSETQNLELVRKMLDKLWKLNVPEGAILHSDQGSIYTSKAYQKMLKDHGVRQSMSRKGNCYDNSVMENFFGTMKREMYNGEKFENIEELKKAIDKYIDYYNNERIRLTLNGLSPVQYRTEYEKNKQAT